MLFWNKARSMRRSISDQKRFWLDITVKGNIEIWIRKDHISLKVKKRLGNFLWYDFISSPLGCAWCFFDELVVSKKQLFDQVFSRPFWCAGIMIICWKLPTLFPLKDKMVLPFIFDSCVIFFRRFRWLSFQMTNQDTRTMKGEVVRLHICVLTIDISASNWDFNRFASLKRNHPGIVKSKPFSGGKGLVTDCSATD